MEAMMDPNPQTPKTTSANFLKRSWCGDEKLWKVFWIYGVLAGAILQSIVLVLGTAGVVGGLGMIVGVPVIAIVGAYAIWICVSMWQCAWNAKAKIWGYIVRVLTVLSFISYIMSIITLSGLFIFGSAVESVAGKVKEHNESAVSQTVTSTSEDGAVTTTQTREDGSVYTKTVSKDGAVHVSIKTGTNLVPAPGVVAPETSAVPSASSMDACEKKMTDYALQNNGDPKAYIAQNQAYLAQCRQALSQPTPVANPAPQAPVTEGK